MRPRPRRRRRSRPYILLTPVHISERVSVKRRAGIGVGVEAGVSFLMIFFRLFSFLLKVSFYVFFSFSSPNSGLSRYICGTSFLCLCIITSFSLVHIKEMKSVLWRFRYITANNPRYNYNFF